MSNIAGLLEVGPFQGDTEETYDFRKCDLCYEAGYNDIWNRTEMRTMYFDPAEKLNVCEHCVTEYLADKP